MASYYILRGFQNDPSSFPCLAAWFVANSATVHAVGAPEPGEYNGALGTDPANDVLYQGIQVLADTPAPKCQRIELFPWDGTSRPLEDSIAKGGPPPYSASSAAADAAKQTLKAAGSAVKTSANELQNALFAALLIIVVLHFTGKK